jgi:hypothetical protein
MTGALVYKEFRETLPIAALGLAALLLVALDAMGNSPLPDVISRFYGNIPFVSDTFGELFALVAGGLALALGFWQALGDFWGDAQLFVLHRPVSRQRIYSVKLTVGIATYLICGLVPILLYALWAATPGTHASPFEWSMTTNVWMSWLAMVTIYLGAFLSGIRPAAWVGTRLAPLAAAMTIALLPSVLGSLLPPGAAAIAVLALLAADVALAISILHVTNTRDFA